MLLSDWLYKTILCLIAILWFNVKNVKKYYNYVQKGLKKWQHKLLKFPNKNFGQPTGNLRHLAFPEKIPNIPVDVGLGWPC